MGQKRRRIALSCVACRRRKVKCDRTFPSCIRCQKGGVSCDYVSYTSGKLGALPTPTDDSPHVQRERSVDSWEDDANMWHERSANAENSRSQQEAVAPSVPRGRPPTKTLQELQEKMHTLETYVKIAGTKPLASNLHLGMGHQAGASTSSFSQDLQEHERALLRGKSFKTQYYGPSQATSLLLQYEELSRFAKEILHKLPQLESYRDAFKAQRKDPAAIIAANLAMSDADSLLSMVPEKDRCDALVQEYFATFETTMRVLHAPIFFQRYKDFWITPTDTHPVFIAQLLLVCACVNVAVPGVPLEYIGRSSLARDSAMRWVRGAEQWLDLQSHKHVTLEMFQVRVLVVMAKKVNCVKIKREWTVAGHLLRLAMSSGLHREPTFLSSSISVFDQEMRRRLWHTILEIEFQASLERGMPGSLGPLDWDCLPPLNIHDEEFDPTTEKMPPSKPITEFTRTSFLCLAQKHLQLRMEVLSSVNSVRDCLDYESVIELDQKVRGMIDGLPDWKDASTSYAARDLAELVLYELLLVIHEPFASKPNAPSKYFYARSARRHAALTILKTYADMELKCALSFCNTRDDMIRACLATCHDVVVSRTPKDSSLIDTRMGIDFIEKVVELMETRIRCLGVGFHTYWISSSASALVRSKFNPSVPEEEFTQKTASRVASLHSEMMAKQQAVTAEQPAGDAAPGTPTNCPPSMDLPQGQSLTGLDPFTSMGQFSALENTLFDFDLGDIWDLGSHYPQF